MSRWGVPHPGSGVRRKGKKNQKGLVLLEVLVVLAILGILVGLAVPRVTGLVRQARFQADQASLETLGRATALFRAHKPVPDPFADESHSSAVLMGELVDGGYLASPVEPQSTGGQFLWGAETGRWYLEIGETLQPGPTPAGFFSVHGARSHEIIGYDVTGGADVVIPGEIDGVPITRIAGAAGQGAFQNKDLASVLLPDSITFIGNNAFRNNGLTAIKLPEELVSIGTHAFTDNQITEIVIPDDVTSVGGGAFHNNPIGRITIGDGVAIGDSYSFGIHRAGGGFQGLYESPDGGAGTYVWDGSGWGKLPD